MNEYLLFTDLDGTLLNHHDYSFKDADRALERIKERNIPMIIVTSKTFAEVIELQVALDICFPFIVENGAGMFVPRSSELANEDWHKDQEIWIKVSESKSYLESRLFIKSVKEKYAIRGFADMDVQEVAELTGLDVEDADKAMKRDFTEPFLIEDPLMIPELTQAANALGFDIVQGGRFFHLITLYQDKAKAMLRLKLLYEECYQHSLKSIALGDSSNDFTMLQAADYGILIPKYDGTYAPIVSANLIKAPFPGPKGWNSSVLEILDAD